MRSYRNKTNRLTVAVHLAIVILIVVLVSASGEAQAPQSVCGDPDDDGAITVVDLVNCVRFFLGAPSSASLEVCDVNGDGQLNALDIQTIVNAVLLLSSACQSQSCDCSLFGAIGGVMASTSTPVRAIATAGCGDADGNSAISVTDGVQVLRAAANLSSLCLGTPACDVDDNGTISVTDGVNVLRAAAGLPATLRCKGGLPSPTPTPLATTSPATPMATPTPTEATVSFSVSPCAQGGPAVPGLGPLTKYPGTKGTFQGATTDATCQTSNDVSLGVNAERDGELRLVLVAPNGSALAFPIHVSCTFHLNAGETLTQDDIDAVIPSVAILDDNGIPSSGGPGVLCVQLDVSPK